MSYFYRHSEGQIIEKPTIVVERGGGPWQYFDSPFVREWWFENDLLRPLPTQAPRQIAKNNPNV